MQKHLKTGGKCKCVYGLCYMYTYIHAGDSGCAARLFVNTIDYGFFSRRSEKRVGRWFVGMKLHKLKDKSKRLDISPAVTSFKGISKY